MTFCSLLQYNRYQGESYLWCICREITVAVSDFITSEIKGHKPTLLFSKGNRIMDHLLKLEEVFATKFPFGRGGLNENRSTKVSKGECIWHYRRIDLLVAYSF